MSKATIQEFGEIYSNYAAGCLDPAFALMVETQAALRPDVNRALTRANILAGIFFETEREAQLSEGAAARALEMIEAHEAREAIMRKAAGLAGEALEEILALPEPLREAVLETSMHQSWQSLTPGIRRLKLETNSQAEVELYRIEPGRTVPKHSHGGSELTLVVAGGFSDETGSFGPGDISIKGPDDVHQPTGDMDGVCYALAISEGGLRFTGMLGVVQRLVGR